jgi:hypothetical protein
MSVVTSESDVGLHRSALDYNAISRVTDNEHYGDEASNKRARTPCTFPVEFDIYNYHYGSTPR